MALQTKDFSVTVKSRHGKITYTYTLRVTENSTDPVKNCSNVTVQAILQQTYSGTAFAKFSTGVSCVIDGQTLFSDYCQRSIAGKEEHVYYTWQGDLPHDPDGTRTILLSGKLWQTTAADYTPPTMNIPQGEMTLTPIGRASRVGATDCAIGSASAVVITPAGEGVTHTLHYVFGQASGYVYPDGSIGDIPQRLYNNTLSFEIPEAFYDQIPDKPRGECILTCDTYLGDTCIGSTQTVFQVTADESRCGPLAGWTLRDTNPDTLALTGDAGMLIRYMSCLQVTLQTQARFGASIVRRLVNGREVGEETAEFSQVESGAVTALVTDSRGYTCRLDTQMSLIPYVKLTNNAAVTRTSPTSGQAQLRFAGNCYCGSFGIVDNALHLAYRLCPEDGEFTPWQELECAIGEDHTYSLTWELTGLDYTKSYRLQVRAADALEQTQRELTVMPGIPVYHWKKDRFYFHVPVEFDDTVSGAYIRRHTLYGANQLTLSLTPGQSVFLFGASGSLWGVTGRGGSWWGSAGVSVQAEDDRVTLILSAPVSGDLVLISDRQFYIE